MFQVSGLCRRCDFENLRGMIELLVPIRAIRLLKTESAKSVKTALTGQLCFCDVSGMEYFNCHLFLLFYPQQ